MEKIDCGERLKIALAIKKITQARLNELTGISKTTIVEALKGNATYRTIGAIADAIGYSIEWLTGTTDDPTPKTHGWDPEVLEICEQLSRKPSARRKELVPYIKGLLALDPNGLAA